MENREGVCTTMKDSRLDDLRKKRLAYFSQSKDDYGIDQDIRKTALIDADAGWHSRGHHVEERKAEEMKTSKDASKINGMVHVAGWETANDNLMDTNSMSCVTNHMCHALQRMEQQVTPDVRSNKPSRESPPLLKNIQESPSQVNTSVWNSPKSPVVRSSFDIGELGLSTHRPESHESVLCNNERESLRYPIDSQEQPVPPNHNNIALEDTICDAELRELLGEEKYQEFLAKSRRDIEALKLERKASPGRLNEIHGKSVTKTDGAKKLINEQSTRNGDMPFSPVCTDVSNQLPFKLNRPKHAPPLVSSVLVKSRGDLDKELPQVHQDYGVKNYEQTSVSRNVVYSSNEIYKQAFNEIPYNPYLNYNGMHMYQGAPQSLSPRELERLRHEGYPPVSYINFANQQNQVYNQPMMFYSNPSSPHSPVFAMSPPVFSPHPPSSSRGQGMMAQPPLMFLQSVAPPSNRTHDAAMYPVPVPQPPNEPPQRKGHFVTHPQVSDKFALPSSYYRQHENPVVNAENNYPSQTENFHAGTSNMVNETFTSWPRYDHTDNLVPHPPSADKNPTRHPQREHIEGVRHFHENRLRLKTADSQELNSTEQYAVERLEKYFSSIEGLYVPKGSPKMSNGISHFEIDAPVQEAFRRPVSPMDEELETLVASTITNLREGGVTERLKKLGIEIPFVDNTSSGSGTNELKQAKICTECSALNKSYMSWCASCGEVLIGVGSTGVSSSPKQIPVQAEGEDSGFDDRVSPPKPRVQFLDGPSKTRYRERLSEHESPNFPKKPFKSDTIDSGRGPSSGEDREKIQYSGRPDKEIIDICQSIDDPVIRGFLKSYLRKRNCFTGSPTKTKKRNQSHSSGNKASKSSDLRKPDVDKFIHNEDVWLHEAKCSTAEVNTPAQNSAADRTKIDIEVFGLEEGGSSSTVSRNGHEIPLLDLGFSSDDEVKPGKQLDLTLTDDDDDDYNDGDVHQVEVGQGDAPLPESMLAELQSDPRVANFQSAKFAHTNGTPKTRTCTQTRDNKSNPSKQNPALARNGRKNEPTQSKSAVRASVDGKPPKRHWMRSSIAWSTYNPGELNKERSVPPHSKRRGRRQRHSQVSQSLQQEGLSSGDSNEDIPLSTQTPVQRRPASADIHRRKAKIDTRPGSAGGGRRKNQWEGQRDINLKSRTMNMRQILGVAQSDEVSSVSVNTSVTDAVEEEVREFVPIPVPVTCKTDVTSPIACPVGTPGHLTAQSAYDKYHSLTPRISNGSVSVWECLPDEILLFVFLHLPLADLASCTRVCKQFYRVAMDQSLWRSIVLTKRQDLSDETMEVIGQRQPISLSLIQCHGNTVTASGLQKLFQHCGSNLEELNISRCSRGGLVGDSVLLQASVRCKHLTHLDVSWTYVTNNGLSAISSTALRLESVCMNGCQSISNYGLETLLRKHGKSLRVLELFGCFNINQAGIRSIAQHCHNLLTLNLGQCYKLTDSSVTEVTGALPRLESLDIRGCKQVRDNSVRRIVKNCPRLMSLALANCPHISDVALCEIATYLTRIKWIDLCGCKNITDESLRALCKNCQNLQYLDISSTSCTKKSVSYLAGNCNKRLEVAKLNFLTDIDEASVVRLVKACPRADFHRSFIWCCLTETTCRRHPASPLTQSHYTDTGPTSRCSNSYCCAPSEAAAAPTVRVFGLTRPRHEPGSPSPDALT